MLQSRRDFNARLLGSVMAYGLIETIFRHDLFADPAKPIIKKWMADLATLTQDLKDQKLKDLELPDEARRPLQARGSRGIDPADRPGPAHQGSRVSGKRCRQPRHRPEQRRGTAGETVVRQADLRLQEGPLHRAARP